MPPEKFTDCMINLSSIFLSDAELCLLGKGLKFVPIPRNIPVIDMITGVEEIIPHVSEEMGSELRNGVRKITRSAFKPVSNLTDAEKNLYVETEGRRSCNTANRKGRLDRGHG